jgi:hypothetical protein
MDEIRRTERNVHTTNISRHEKRSIKNKEYEITDRNNTKIRATGRKKHSKVEEKE